MQIDYYKYFKKKYPHLEEEDIQILEFSSKETLIHLLFKSKINVSESKKDKAYKDYHYWILKCMQEMIERAGMTSAVSYKENGISITWGRENLSQALIDEIVPVVEGW